MLTYILSKDRPRGYGAAGGEGDWAPWAKCWPLIHPVREDSNCRLRGGEIQPGRGEATYTAISVGKGLSGDLNPPPPSSRGHGLNVHIKNKRVHDPGLWLLARPQ